MPQSLEESRLQGRYKEFANLSRTEGSVSVTLRHEIEKQPTQGQQTPLEIRVENGLEII